MSLTVIKAGLQTTVQDLGRNGFAHLGISGSGAADPYSLRLGNLLVGNLEDEAGLEMTLVGGKYQFGRDAFVSLTGSYFITDLNGKDFPFYENVYVEQGQIINIGSSRDGARCYLTVRGGFDIEPVLGSKSTHIMTKMGGFSGRPLKNGDEINFGDVNQIIEPTKIKNNIIMDRSLLRITKGIQHDWFDPDVWDLLQNNSFKVSHTFDRMGIRVKGEKINTVKNDEVLTEGIPIGAVQVPTNGQPIISFVDHQTTGGYPKIANVITADLCKVGQLKYQDEFQFQLVSMEEAESLRLAQESFINELKYATP